VFSIIVAYYAFALGNHQYLDHIVLVNPGHYSRIKIDLLYNVIRALA
jgi:hypothetical protein